VSALFNPARCAKARDLAWCKGRMGRGSQSFGAVLAVVLVAFGCAGRSRSDETDRARAGATASGGSGAASGGSAGSLGGRSPRAGSAGETWQGGGPADDSIPLDASDCSARPQGDCTGVTTQFTSNGAFDAAPALAECSEFNSFDGCGKLVFTFDSNGCATSVGPGPGGWDASGHLTDLRTCLSGALGGGRFVCLTSSTLGYDESCFVP
jgi:hypothetical protein